jgi:hypothetical protein
LGRQIFLSKSLRPTRTLTAPLQKEVLLKGKKTRIELDLTAKDAEGGNE